jgi:hypothetical protein
MDRFEIEELVAELDRSAPALLRIRLSGRSASRDAGAALAPLFAEALGAAGGEGRALELHFEGLEYFNSSTIAALVQFIRAAHQARVGLTVVYDARQRWQAMSFDALRRALRPFETSEGPAVQFAVA